MTLLRSGEPALRRLFGDQRAMTDTALPSEWEVERWRVADKEDTMSDAETTGASSESDAGPDEQYEHTEIDLLYVRADGVPYDLKQGQYAGSELAMDTATQRLPEHRVEVLTSWHTVTVYYDTLPSFVQDIDDTTGVLQVVMSRGGTVVQVMAAQATAFPGGAQFKQHGFRWYRSYP